VIARINTLRFVPELPLYTSLSLYDNLFQSIETCSNKSSMSRQRRS